MLRGPDVAIAGMVFLALFTFDGLLSVTEELFRGLTGSLAMVPVRDLVATVTIRAAVIAAVLCACSPRLPAKIHLPPVLAAFWLALGALPVPMWVAPALASPLLCAFELAVGTVACAAFALVIRRSGGLPAFERARAGFSARRLAGFAAAGSLALPVVGLGYGVLSLADFIENATDGFIDVHPGGVSIADRRYVKGDREVRLVGMMHVGESESYDALFESFTGDSTLVLEEGITDRYGSLANPLSYGKVAAAIGLDAQGSVSEYFEESRHESGNADGPGSPDVRRENVDVSDFSPVTIGFIERAAKVWSADDPLVVVGELMLDPPSNDELETLFEEIVSMRNERVLAELESAAPEYRRVIVPWGALHLPGIARALEQQGFVLEEETQRLLLSWSTILAVLVR